MVSDQVQQYLSSQAHIAESTKNLYAIVLNKLEKFCEEKGIETIDETFEHQMDDFCQFIIDSGAKGKTIQSYIAIFRTFSRAIGHSIKYSYKLTSGEKKESQFKSINRWFTEDDVKKCIEYKFQNNHQRNHLIVRILNDTGIRVNELSEIRVKNIGPDPQTILIGESKTRIRYVFVSPETSLLLKDYMTTIESEDLFWKYDSKKLFDVTTGQIKRVIDGMLNDLEINSDGRGPHTFRHWVATYLFYEGGMKIEDIATLLGDTPEIITSTYLHPTPNMLKKSVSVAWGW